MHMLAVLTPVTLGIPAYTLFKCVCVCVCCVIFVSLPPLAALSVAVYASVRVPLVSIIVRNSRVSR